MQDMEFEIYSRKQGWDKIEAGEELDEEKQE